MSLRGDPAPAGDETAEELLERVQGMVPAALEAARAAGGFPGRWKAIAAKLETLPACLSDLSSHPCFAKNALCRELLQSVAATLAEAADLAGRCREPPPDGKLRTQSAIDALAGKLDLNLRDCALLVKTGVLSDASGPSPPPEAAAAGSPAHADVRELLARLQIGQTEAKNRAVDGLLEALRKDEKSVLAVLGRANVSAMVQLLTASAPVVRGKAATVVCQVAESGSCDGLLVSEGVLPPLIRLAESGSLVGREKAALTLQRLSVSPDVARAIVGHGGAGPLIEICQTGDSVSQSAAAGALKNLSAVPEVRQALADEGIVRVMVTLLDPAQVARKCIVIMEGNPHPGAVKGRMSFQNFNPSIDKLNAEARGDCETESASPSSHNQDSANSSRGDEVPASRFRGFDIDSSESISLNELKRKQPELEMETPPSHNNPRKISIDGRSSSQSNGRGSHKSNKREKKLDFNHLRQKK